jgi:hypothetical protein
MLYGVVKEFGKASVRSSIGWNKLAVVVSGADAFHGHCWLALQVRYGMYSPNDERWQRKTSGSLASQFYHRLDVV